MGRLHLPHWKVEDLASYYSYGYACPQNLVYQMYSMEKPTRRHTGRWQCNARLTPTHLFKLNGGVPRMSLGLSFQRDLLYMAARLPKKVRDCTLHRLLYQRRSDKWCGQWPTPPTELLFWCILRHCMSMSVCDILAWKCGWKPRHGVKYHYIYWIKNDVSNNNVFFIRVFHK